MEKKKEAKMIGGGSEQYRFYQGDYAKLPVRCPVCGYPLRDDGFCENCREYPEEVEDEQISNGIE